MPITINPIIAANHLKITTETCVLVHRKKNRADQPIKRAHIVVMNMNIFYTFPYGVRGVRINLSRSNRKCWPAKTSLPVSTDRRPWCPSSISAATARAWRSQCWRKLWRLVNNRSRKHL